jgi:hypothetical protein
VASKEIILEEAHVFFCRLLSPVGLHRKVLYIEKKKNLRGVSMVLYSEAKSKVLDWGIKLT